MSWFESINQFRPGPVGACPPPLVGIVLDRSLPLFNTGRYSGTVENRNVVGEISGCAPAAGASNRCFEERISMRLSCGGLYQGSS